MNVPTTRQGTEMMNGATANGWVESPEDQADLIIPRAKIFQGSASEQKRYPGATMGQIINHLTGDELPSKFVPIFKFVNTVKFNPRKKEDPNFDPNFAPGAVIWNINDPHDPRWQEGEFGVNGEKPTATRFMSFMVLFEGDTFPTILSFSSTSYKVGKKFFSMLAMTPGSKHGRKFELSTQEKQTDQGEVYYIYNVVPAGTSTPEEQETCAQVEAALKPRAQEFSVADEPAATEEDAPWQE